MMPQGRPQREYTETELCETVFYLSRYAECMELDSSITVPDERELFWMILDAAKKFEQDLDPAAEDHQTKLEAYGQNWLLENFPYVPEPDEQWQTSHRRDNKMILKAVVGCAQHPEYGYASIPFPIPSGEYDNTMELLDGLGIGDALRQDCKVIDMESNLPVLDRLVGTEVNADELDYLAKRLDSFCGSEDEQFQAMAHKLDLVEVKDLINLTFCCQEVTVISDFSDLEKIGRTHHMNLNGGGMPAEKYEALDGQAEALDLILNGQGTVTPYGVVYDNGMKLEQIYQGGQFPPYCDDDYPLTVRLTPKQGGESVCMNLPCSDRQLGRSLLRAGIDNLRNTELSVEIDNLPQKVSDRLHLDREGLDDLNAMCRVIKSLTTKQREMLEAVVCAVQPDHASEVRRLGEELDQFEFVPGIHTLEEYGRYMIRESGHYDYDANLEGFYDYRAYGEQRVHDENGLFTAHGYVAYRGTMPLEELMRDDPAEQYQREQGMQML